MLGDPFLGRFHESKVGEDCRPRDEEKEWFQIGAGSSPDTAEDGPLALTPPDKNGPFFPDRDIRADVDEIERGEAVGL